MLYYVYIHIRKDTNEVFYVGIGKQTVWRKSNGARFTFSRAYEKSKRSRFWHNIVNKTDYIVKIVYESDSRIDVQNKEKELIKLYGRRDLGTGTLVNHTAGGEDTLECKRNANVSIIQLSLNGEFIKQWNQLKYIEEELGYLKTNIVKCCRKKQITAYGYRWEYVNNKFSGIRASSSRKPWLNPYKEVEVYKDNILIETISGITECAKKYNICRHTLRKYINMEIPKELRGFIFKRRKVFRNKLKEI